ncbi:nucleotide-binding oligomerization domain-containing protein 2 isoform X2 [Amia ocellicauda]|uniref:nucleotide-binding oligomerization domain-containing protein 2 isoform X2 n=1 Tax=Amia ocellicauda TaxID=2972642 RepID=UPI0034646B52
MCAQRLVLRQRQELVRVLSWGGVEGLESVLDILLAWDALQWEDYESLRTLGRALSLTTRELLDLLYAKGEAACALLLAACNQALPDAQKAGLSLGSYGPPSVVMAPQPPLSSAQVLQRDRPQVVRKLRGHTEGVLETLLEAGCFTLCDCDEVRLPIHTPSQQARRLLDLVRSKGEPAAEVLLLYVQKAGNGAALSLPEDRHPADVVYQAFQHKLRSMVAAQSCFLSTYGGMENISLEDVYTEGVLEGSGEAQCPLGLEDLLGSVGTVNEEADTVLVAGEAGSGKSTLLQRLHLLWANRVALQDYLLLFPFSCRQLGALGWKLSLRELLFQHCCWPDGDQDLLFRFILDHPNRVLFTFDGLDELNPRFSDDLRHCSPTQPAPPSTLLFNLLQGTLMKGVHKLVTSRPEAVGPVLRKYVRKEVSLRGFSQEGIGHFVRKHHSDPAIAARVLDSLQANTALLGMCHIPVFCWIVSRCYEELLGRGVGSPQTITDVYLMILQHFLQHSCPQQCLLGPDWLQVHVDTVLHLGQLALCGLVSSCYVFSALQLQQYSVTEEDISTGFLVHSRNLTPPGSPHYEFLHVTAQCFFAALFIVLNNNIENSTIPKLFHPRNKPLSALASMCLAPCLHPSSVGDAGAEGDIQAAETINLQMTGAFVAGLLSRRHCDLLARCSLGPILDKKRKQVVKSLCKGTQRHFRSIPPPVEGEKKSMHAMPGFVWLVRCIYEMQDCGLAKEAVARLDVEHLKLTYCGVGPVECSALAFVLQHLRAPIGLQLDYNSVGDVGIEQLLPCLEICQSIYLRHNNISDVGICKLIDKGIQCEHFQKIALFNNNLTDECTKHFAKLLRMKKNFLSLSAYREERRQWKR